MNSMRDVPGITLLMDSNSCGEVWSCGPQVHLTAGCGFTRPVAMSSAMRDRSSVKTDNSTSGNASDFDARPLEQPGGRSGASIGHAVRTDMCTTCEYTDHMAKMIQLRNVPDALHRQLKARAAMAGLSLSDFLIREARKIAEQPTPEEMAERLRQREPYRGKMSPTQVLREERDAR